MRNQLKPVQNQTKDKAKPMAQLLRLEQPKKSSKTDNRRIRAQDARQEESLHKLVMKRNAVSGFTDALSEMYRQKTARLPAREAQTKSESNHQKSSGESLLSYLQTASSSSVDEHEQFMSVANDVKSQQYQSSNQQYRQYRPQKHFKHCGLNRGSQTPSESDTQQEEQKSDSGRNATAQTRFLKHRVPRPSISSRNISSGEWNEENSVSSVKFNAATSDQGDQDDSQDDQLQFADLWSLAVMFHDQSNKKSDEDYSKKLSNETHKSLIKDANQKNMLLSKHKCERLQTEADKRSPFSLFAPRRQMLTQSDSCYYQSNSLSEAHSQQSEYQLRQDFTRYFKAQEQIKNELSMHPNNDEAAQSNSAQDATDNDVPMIESFYDDGDDLDTRFIVHGCLSSQRAIPSQKAKYESYNLANKSLN